MALLVENKENMTLPMLDACREVLFFWPLN